MHASVLAFAESHISTGRREHMLGAASIHTFIGIILNSVQRFTILACMPC